MPYDAAAQLELKRTTYGIRDVYELYDSRASEVRGLEVSHTGETKST